MQRRRTSPNSPQTCRQRRSPTPSASSTRTSGWATPTPSARPTPSNGRPSTGPTPAKGSSHTSSAAHRSSLDSEKPEEGDDGGDDPLRERRRRRHIDAQPPRAPQRDDEPDGAGDV